MLKRCTEPRRGFRRRRGSGWSSLAVGFGIRVPTAFVIPAPGDRRARRSRRRSGAQRGRRASREPSPRCSRKHYPGRFALTLVDDRSDDGTGDGRARDDRARRGRARSRASSTARPRPDGWTGKVWALAEGVAAARAGGARPRIGGSPMPTWSTIPTRSRDWWRPRARRAARLVSQMVALHCASPRGAAADSGVRVFLSHALSVRVGQRRRAARRRARPAAACCLRDDVLARIGGLARIRGELIDDCSLAAAVKGDGRRLVARPDDALAQRATVRARSQRSGRWLRAPRTRS